MADKAGDGTLRRKVLGLIGGALVASLTGCGVLFPTTYRFRMTVEVDTPEGVKTGSSVYEVAAANTLEFLPEGAKRTWDVKGEAVAVDLPGGRTMFALLRTNNLYRRDVAKMSMAALDPAFSYDIVESAGRIRRGERIRSPARVPFDDYPRFVTFADPQNSMSVALVDPTNLAATFGPGVRLKAITVAITDDPVTTGVKKRLPKPPYGRPTIFQNHQTVEQVDLKDFRSGLGK